MPAARPALDADRALLTVRESIAIVECLDRRRNVVAQGTGVIVAADTGVGLERVHAQLDRLDPLVGAELSWVKIELGLGFLEHQPAFWEDAIEARAFRRAAKSSRRAEWEERLLGLGALTRRDVADGDRIMRAIAAHEPLDIPGARIDPDERWIAQTIGGTYVARDHIETRLWAARSR